MKEVQKDEAQSAQTSVIHTNKGHEYLSLQTIQRDRGGRLDTTNIHKTYLHLCVPANNSWTSTMGLQSPLWLKVTGRVGGANAHDFDHVYTFTEYKPGSVPATELEVRLRHFL